MKLYELTKADHDQVSAILGIAKTDDDASRHEPVPTKADYYESTSLEQQNTMWSKLPADVQTEIRNRM